MKEYLITILYLRWKTTLTDWSMKNPVPDRLTLALPKLLGSPQFALPRAKHPEALP